MEDPLVRQPRSTSGKIITHNAHLLLGDDAYNAPPENTGDHNLLQNVQLDDDQNGSVPPVGINNNYDDGYAPQETEDQRPASVKSHSSELSREMDKSPIDDGRQSVDSLDEEYKYQRELKERVKRSYADLGMAAEGILVQEDENDVTPRDSLEINENLPYDQIKKYQGGPHAEQIKEQVEGDIENIGDNNLDAVPDSTGNIQGNTNVANENTAGHDQSYDYAPQDEADPHDTVRNGGETNQESYDNEQDSYANEQNQYPGDQGPYANQQDSYAHEQLPYGDEQESLANDQRSHTNEEDSFPNEQGPYTNNPPYANEESYANEQYANNEPPYSNKEDPYADEQYANEAPYPNEDFPFANGENETGNGQDPFPPDQNPFINQQDPYDNRTGQYTNKKAPLENEQNVHLNPEQESHGNGTVHYATEEEPYPINDSRGNLEDHTAERVGQGESYNQDEEVFRDSLEDDNFQNTNNNAKLEEKPPSGEGRTYAHAVNNGSIPDSGNNDHDNDYSNNQDNDQDGYGQQQSIYGNGTQEIYGPGDLTNQTDDQKDPRYPEDTQNEKEYQDYPRHVDRNSGYADNGINNHDEDYPRGPPQTFNGNDMSSYGVPSASQKSSASRRNWQIDPNVKSRGNENQQKSLSAYDSAIPLPPEHLQRHLSRDEALIEAKDLPRSRDSEKLPSGSTSRQYAHNRAQPESQNIARRLENIEISRNQRDENEFEGGVNPPPRESQVSQQGKAFLQSYSNQRQPSPQLHKVETNPFTVAQSNLQLDQSDQFPPQSDQLPFHLDVSTRGHQQVNPSPAGKTPVGEPQEGGVSYGNQERQRAAPAPPSQSYQDLAHKEVVRTAEDRNSQLRGASSARSYLEQHKMRQSPQRYSPNISAKSQRERPPSGNRHGRINSPLSREKRETLESAKGYQGYGRKENISQQRDRQHRQTSRQASRKDSTNNLGSMASLDSLRFQGLPREKSQTLKHEDSVILQKLPSGETLEVAYISDDSDDDDLHFVDDLGNPVDSDGKLLDPENEIKPEQPKLQYRIKPAPPKKNSPKKSSGVRREISATSNIADRVQSRGITSGRSETNRKVSKTNQGSQFPSAYGLRRQKTMDKAVGESKAPTPAPKAEEGILDVQIEEEIVPEVAAVEGVIEDTLPPPFMEEQPSTDDGRVDPSEVSLSSHPVGGEVRVSSLPEQGAGIISPGAGVQQVIPSTNPLQASFSGAAPVQGAMVLAANQPAVFSPNASLTFAQPMYTQLQPVAMSPVQTILQPVIQPQPYAQPVYMGAAPFAPTGQFPQQPQYVFPQQQQQYPMQQPQMLQQNMLPQQQPLLPQQQNITPQLQNVLPQQNFAQQQPGMLPQGQVQGYSLEELEESGPLTSRTYNVNVTQDEEQNPNIPDEEENKVLKKRPSGVRALLAERSKAAKPTKTKPAKPSKNFIDANKNNVKNEPQSKSYKKLFSAKKRAKSEPINPKKPLPSISQEDIGEEADEYEEERDEEAWARHLLMEQQMLQLRRNHSESDVFNRFPNFAPVRQGSFPSQEPYNQPYYQGVPNYYPNGGPVGRNPDHFYSWSADRAAAYARMRGNPRLVGPKVAFTDNGLVNQRDSLRINMTDDERQQFAYTHPVPTRISPYDILPDIQNERATEARLSDPNGYLVKLQKQRRPPNYKEYTLKDYRSLKRDLQLGGLGPDKEEVKERQEKAQRQRQYAKAVMEQNKKTVQMKPWQPPPSRLKPEEIANKRKVALNYAKNIPRPRIPTPPEELHARMYGSQSDQNSNIQQRLLDELSHLDELAERHRREKEQVDKM